MTRTIECLTCGGTGLLPELDGAAVVCERCNGTGKTEIDSTNFEEGVTHVFKGRREMKGVTRVFKGLFGYAHTDKDIVTEDGRVLHFSRFGCSYEDWKNGVEPTYMEELYCPYMCCNRGAGNEPCSRCKTGTKDSCSIKECDFYSDKSNCWKEWHEKND